MAGGTWAEFFTNEIFTRVPQMHFRTWWCSMKREVPDGECWDSANSSSPITSGPSCLCNADEHWVLVKMRSSNQLSDITQRCCTFTSHNMKLPTRFCESSCVSVMKVQK